MNTLKHSFQEVEETANERVKEELLVGLVQDLKLAKMQATYISNKDIASAISEGLGDDAKEVGGLLCDKNTEKRGPIERPIDSFLQYQKLFYDELNKALKV